MLDDLVGVHDVEAGVVVRPPPLDVCGSDVEAVSQCQRAPPRVGSKRFNHAGETGNVARGGALRVHVWVHDLPRAARVAHDDRSPAGHRLGDYQTEWLGPRAGVDDDVERPQRRRAVGEEAGETDAITNPELAGKLPELLSRVLTAGGLVNGPSDHVAANEVPGYGRLQILGMTGRVASDIGQRAGTVSGIGENADHQRAER